MAKYKKIPPLVKRIRDALVQVGNTEITLHVSIAREPKWEKRSTGEEVLVRWLCWSIEGQEDEIVGPTYEVLSEVVTEAKIKAELPGYFPGIKILIDNDVD